ncbi:MAG: fibro-slime domain-containing protein [Sandaracinus sp.]|nr:fibro-slime domain-containing protein [Sandaracinus sp.]
MRWFGLLLLLAACDCDSIDATDATDEPDRDGGADAATPDLGTDDAGVDAGPRDFGPGGGDRCGSLTATVRDFRSAHADMEAPSGDDRGLVEEDLGPDRKPVYAPDGPTLTVSGQTTFDEWYRDVDGTNLPFTIELPLTEESAGVYVFDDSEFFPLDDMGFGNEDNPHNFHFTTEIHATFRYRGGETFTFRGDDDVFVFVNGKQVIDLGGIHAAEMASVDFDAEAERLGITVGNTYSLDVFHAERHVVQSNFRVETSIDCFILE